MGSSESTGRSNGTNEEEERQPENNNSSGGSGGSGTAIAVAAAGTAVALWGISRMLSGDTNTDEKEKEDAMAMKASSLTEASYRPNSYTNNRIVLEGNHGSSSMYSTWSPPPLDRFKMNTDGAARTKQGPDRPNTGPSGYGGILRDHCGKWVQGFHGFIGESDCLTAEFHGILKGLELLDELDLKESILETDSTAAIGLIKQEPGSYRRNRPVLGSLEEIVTECRRLVQKNKVEVIHVDGDTGNRCADKLANMAIDSHSREGHVVLKALPHAMKNLVNGDLKSSSYHYTC